ncbi:Heme-binding protein 2 [Schistosoma japonicum]|nr:Heme-binding protein 2 [Schistosoma japonicum]
MQLVAAFGNCSDILVEKMRKVCDFLRLLSLAETKVPMTAPVTVESKSDHTSVKKCFTVGFYIPEVFQPDPPTPTEEGVFIETRPAMEVYCRTYSGHSNDEKVLDNVRKLGESLDQLGLKYTPDLFYFAGYDPPFKLTKRRNEIWFKAD